MAKKKGKTGRKKGPEQRLIGARVDADLLPKLDAMAREVGLSRSQLVNRLLKDIVRMQQQVSTEGGLFSEWAGDFERIIEQALDRAVREGGIDAVLQASRTKKGTRKP